MTATRSAHDILGVSRDATADDVRRAYRRLALRHHPDRNPGDPSAAEAFLEVQDAFEALDVKDRDAGFDIERVVTEMQRAADEVERRRRGAVGGKGWQQMRVGIERSQVEEIQARLATSSARVGLALAVAVGAAVAMGLAPAWSLANEWLGSGGALPVWAPGALAVTLAAAIASRAVAVAEAAPWAVETHWQGVRDLRWDVLVSWAEIRGVRSAGRGLELALTPNGAQRLATLAPAHAFASPLVYRVPVTDASRLLPIIQAQRTG